MSKDGSGGIGSPWIFVPAIILACAFLFVMSCAKDNWDEKLAVRDAERKERQKHVDFVLIAGVNGDYDTTGYAVPGGCLYVNYRGVVFAAHACPEKK